MQAWLVILYYALLAICLVFNYYVLTIKWWSSFNLALLVTFIVILLTAPDWEETNTTADGIFLVLMVLLAVASPIVLFIYVVSQALQDQIWVTCYADPVQ